MMPQNAIFVLLYCITLVNIGKCVSLRVTHNSITNCKMTPLCVWGIFRELNIWRCCVSQMSVVRNLTMLPQCKVRHTDMQTCFKCWVLAMSSKWSWGAMLLSCANKCTGLLVNCMQKQNENLPIKWINTFIGSIGQWTQETQNAKKSKSTDPNKQETQDGKENQGN